MTPTETAAMAVKAAARESGQLCSRIIGHGRTVPLPATRWACWLAMRDAGFTLVEIGTIFCDRDHSTIAHGVNRARGLRQESARYDMLCQAVENSILTNQNQTKQMQTEFKPFPKMPRLSRECIITEKIDGTNASVFISPIENMDDLPMGAIGYERDGSSFYMMVGSRNRWITREDDNAGFAAWAWDNFEQLQQLGPGHHFGEWWGQGIQRKYGMTEKRWSLFNVGRWAIHGTEPQTIPSADPRIIKTQDVLPACCHLVPVLYRGEFCTLEAQRCINALRSRGSWAAPGFLNPEGIVLFHIAGNVGFKKTIEKDNQPKGN